MKQWIVLHYDPVILAAHLKIQNSRLAQSQEMVKDTQIQQQIVMKKTTYLGTTNHKLRLCKAWFCWPDSRAKIAQIPATDATILPQICLMLIMD